jgi:hypothetical protein
MSLTTSIRTPQRQRRIVPKSAATNKGGRQPRTDKASTSRLTIRMTVDERAALEAAAKTNHVCLAEVLREAVNEYVADYGARPVFKEISATQQKAAS